MYDRISLGVTMNLDEKKDTNETAAYDGKIEHCPHQGCGFKCCEFNQGNYILTYPGEIQEARKRGESLSHLELEPYKGGYKAFFKAKDTASCDHGYKPLDCKSYPFFPGVADDQIITALKGKKCPLTYDLLGEHSIWVKNMWEEVKNNTPSLISWLKRIKLVGYEKSSIVKKSYKAVSKSKTL